MTFLNLPEPLCVSHPFQTLIPGSGNIPNRQFRFPVPCPRLVSTSQVIIVLRPGGDGEVNLSPLFRLTVPEMHGVPSKHLTSIQTVPFPAASSSWTYLTVLPQHWGPRRWRGCSGSFVISFVFPVLSQGPGHRLLIH